MPIKYTVAKDTASGERTVVEVSQCHPITGDIMHSEVEMAAMLERVFIVSSDRVLKMNMAHLEAYGLNSYFAPEVWIQFKQMCEVLNGNLDAAVLMSRWQSAAEETAILEQQRLPALTDEEQTKADSLPTWHNYDDPLGIPQNDDDYGHTSHNLRHRQGGGQDSVKNPTGQEVSEIATQQPVVNTITLAVSDED